MNKKVLGKAKQGTSVEDAQNMFSKLRVMNRQEDSFYVFHMSTSY